jgi:hypothetical protein
MTTTAAATEADLLRGVAHLLRSPLGVILNIASTLRDYDDRFTSEQRISYLGDIVQAADEMKVALDGVSLLARLTTGTLAFSPSTVSLADLLSGAGEAIASVWDAGAVPHLTFAAGDASADPRRVAQAFEALARCCSGAASVTLSGAGGAQPCLRLGPVTPRATAEEVEAMLHAPVDSPETGQWISHSGGWALLLARYLLEAQGGRLSAELTGDGLAFVAHLPAPVHG